jgi:uncharacterized protein (TIGR02246 family)
MKKIMLFPLLSMAVLGCGKPAFDAKAEGEKLMQISKDWSQATATGDVEKVVGYWADDAVLIEPGMAVLRGKKDIRQMVEKSFKSPGFKISWEPQSAEVAESGDLGYLVEKSQITFNDSTGKAITQHFNALTVWKKQADGSWKNVVDISTAEP